MKVTDLIELGEKALKMFDEYLEQKGIEPPMRVYIRHFTTDLEVSETACSSQGSSEIIQKPDWSVVVFDFMRERIKPMPEFEQLNRSIVRRYEQNISKLAEGSDAVGQSALWLETFIQRLIHERLEGTLSDNSLIEYASLYRSELELAPLEYRYVHYLLGIFLETDSIRINDHVLIRKTQKDDLEYTRDIFIDSPRTQHVIPSSILVIDISGKDETDCHEYVNRIFNSLRSYKLGSVYSQESTSAKRTVIWPMASYRSWGRTNYSTFRKYTVKESEVDTFVSFVNTIERKLDFHKEEKRYRSLSVSIDRYNSALLESLDIDRKLMTGVMGLESLFTLEKDRGENAFKLGIRAAKLLGQLSFDADRVRSLIEEAYNFRNTVVHGSYISQDRRKRINEISPDIPNYLRISLIAFLLNQQTGKDKMVEMIDKSMISDTRDKELKKILNRNRQEFAEMLT